MAKRTDIEKRALVRLYRNETKLSYRQIAKKCNTSKSAVWRICSKKETEKAKKAGKKKPGRPKKLDERSRRKLLRTLETFRKRNINFCVNDLMKEDNLNQQYVNRRTISRYLNQLGFNYMQARKKGLLNENDKRKRRIYAKKMKNVLKTYPDFYSSDIAFYLDGVSFVHKYNPSREAERPNARIWRRKGEGLNLTSKGSKELAGGRRLHVIVAVAFGRGVVLREPYEKMNGEFFANFVKEHFNLCFAKCGPKRDGQRIFVMDNDPCQNSKLALTALEEVESELHRIPPRSPDLNPIENIFNIVKKTLRDEAVTLNITKENFSSYKERVLQCFDNLDCKIIDRTLCSMPNRIKQIVVGKGKRIKY